MKFDAAQAKTAWAPDHRRRSRWEGKDVFGSAERCDLAGVLDQQPVTICGIADVFSALAMKTVGDGVLRARDSTGSCDQRWRRAPTRAPDASRSPHSSIIGSRRLATLPAPPQPSSQGV